MRKIALAIFFIFTLAFNTAAQELTRNQKKIVQVFINQVKNKDKINLSAKTYFPLDREYPIPSIKNQEEFIKRYSEIFDQSLITIIINSDVSKDWSTVGWRGIMLKNGEVWLDYEGKLMAINYQSSYEIKKKQELINIDKKNLFSELRNYEKPIYLLETSKYRIRIDDIGNNNLRYASWSIKSKINSKPDLVILNGEMIFQGSGGNQSIIFRTNNYTYECSINLIGDDKSPPARIEIYKGDKLILSQEATIIK